MSERLEQDKPGTPPAAGQSGAPDGRVVERSGQSGLKPEDLAAGSNLYSIAAIPPAVSPAADSSLDEGAATTTGAGGDSAKPVTTHHLKSFWREVLETVLLTIIIFFLVKGLVANFRIQGNSMEPNFHTNQLVLVNKASYFHFDANAWLRLVPGLKPEGENVVWLFGGPKRGDVVIFEPPDVHDEDYIKRVIGLPGDTVEVKGGKVYVNNQALDEAYLRENSFSPFSLSKVPPNHLFVLGDNRNASRDSRSFGMLPIDLVVGKALLVYWPFGDKWGLVPETTYRNQP